MSFKGIGKGDLIFIDSNIFIYSFFGQSIDCWNLLKNCESNDIKGFTLTSVLAEVLHRLMIFEALKKGLIKSKDKISVLKRNPDIIKELHEYNKANSIFDMNIIILDLTKEIIFDSIFFRNKYGLLVNDSLIVSTWQNLV